MNNQYFASQNPVFQSTNYTTLGLKFYVFIVLPPKCYFCFVNPWFRCGSAAFYLYIPVPVSKHDLKHFSKSDIFRFTGGVSMDFCPRRATKRHQYLLVYSITTKYMTSITTKYMTLGPKFYTKLVLPPKCYFCFVNPWFRCGSAPFYLYMPVPVSKHDLKHFSKSDLPGFTGGVFMDYCPRRAT